MKIYCMCGSKVVDPKTTTGDKPFEDTKVILDESSVIHPSVGHEQYIQVGAIDECINDKSKYVGSLLKRHYPNVDLYQCPNCGTFIAVEG